MMAIKIHIISFNHFNLQKFITIFLNGWNELWMKMYMMWMMRCSVSLSPDVLSLITLLSQNFSFITFSQLSSHRALSPTETIPLYHMQFSPDITTTLLPPIFYLFDDVKWGEKRMNMASGIRRELHVVKWYCFYGRVCSLWDESWERVMKGGEWWERRVMRDDERMGECCGEVYSMRWESDEKGKILWKESDER